MHACTDHLNLVNLLQINNLIVNTAVDCGFLSAPSNGRVVTPFGTRYLNTATYSCDSGYTLAGSVNRTCGAGGKWTSSQPECLLICK